MRRLLLALAIMAVPCSGLAAQQVHPDQGSVVETIARLKPGEYVWEPQIAPKGPLLLVVNLNSQRALLFRNGVPIAASTVSTGRPGYETPTGIFTVLQKRVEHYSSKYDNAPMPYMQRLTWRGVALHAGNLPGYPASHGCIRLPKGFAKLLYGTTALGMTVVVTDRQAVPRTAPTPEIALRGGDTVTGAAQGISWHPERAPNGPVSIIVSAADNRAIVLRNGIEIGSSPVRLNGGVTGSWAYLLRAVDQAGQHWLRVDLGQGDSRTAVGRDEWARFEAPASFRTAVAGIVVPGTTIIVTPDSLKAGTQGAAVTVLEDDTKPD